MEFLAAFGTLFVALPLGMWLLLGFFLVAEFFFVERDSGVGATCVLIAFFGALFFFYGGLENPIISWIISNWVLVLLLYFPAGMVWMYVRWNSHINDWSRRFEKTKKRFIKRENLNIKVNDPVPPAHKDDWFRYAGSAAVRPGVRKNKNRLLLWIGYWPFSMVWTVTRRGWLVIWRGLKCIGRGIHRVSLIIYRHSAVVLQAMVDKKTSKYGDDTKDSKR